MRFRNVINGLLAVSLLAQTFTVSVFAEDTERKTEDYGVSITSGGDFEDAALGASTSTLWQPYYSFNVAYGEIVTNEGEGNEKNVYAGKKALRFTNVGVNSSGAKNTGRGIYYTKASELNKNALKGETYCFSGYFRTDDPSGTKISTQMLKNQYATLADGSNTATITDEWQEVKFYATLAADKGFDAIRINAMSLNPDCVSSNYSGSYNYDGLKNALDSSDTGYCVYADNLQIRKVLNVGAENLELTATTATSDGILFANYDYWGKNDEGNSILKWLYADSADAAESEWTLYKSVTVSSSDSENEAELFPGSALAGKYVKFSVTPKDSAGTGGDTVYSNALKIEKSSNVLPNGTFAKDLYIWTGNAEWCSDSCESDGSGSMLLKGSSKFSHDSVKFDIDNLKLKISFYAKSNGADTVTVDGNEFTLTNSWTKFEYEKTVNSADGFKIEISSDNCFVDNFSVIPQIPEVFGINITGKYVTGSTVTVSYERSWTGKDNSTVAWYLSDNADGSGAVKISDTASVNLINDYASKYIYAVITPLDDANVKGLPLSTAVTEVVGLYADNLTIESNGYKTNSILVPHYEYHGNKNEGKSRIEWQMAPSLKTPEDKWQTVTDFFAQSTTGIPAANVTAATAPENAYFMLTQAQKNMYVRFKVTPVNADGDEGIAVYSEPTKMIEYERNIVNNGDFSMGLKGWQLSGATKMTYSETGSGNDGTGSVLVDANTKVGTGPSNSGGRMITQYLSENLKANVPYEISFDAKFMDKGQSGGKMSVIVITDKAGGGGVGYLSNTPMSVTNDWTTVKGNDTEAVIGDKYVQYTMACNSADFTVVGQVMFDNFTMCEALPWITNIKVDGNPQVGQTLRATYDFNKIADAGVESGTDVMWQVADYPWSEWKTIKSGSGNASETYSLEITKELEGKYLRFYIEGEDILGNKAEPMWSSEEIFVEPDDEYSYTVDTDTITANEPATITAQFTSAQDLERYITLVAAIYNTVDGKEKMTAISYKTEKVGKLGDADFTLPITPTQNGGTLRVYFMEGNNFKTLKPLRKQSAAGAKTESYKKDILVNNDNASVKIYNKTTVPEEIYAVSVINNDTVDITPENVSSAVKYFGEGLSGSDGSFSFEFSIDGSSAGSKFAVGVVQKNGYKFDTQYFTYYGTDISDAIAAAVLEASADVLGTYLSGTKINDSIDMVDVLNIDLSDYNKLADKNKVLSQIAGKNYSKNTIKIKTDIETLSNQQLEYEVWTANMDAFIADLNSADADTLAAVLKKHNGLFNLDLDNEYGFALNLNSVNRKSFNTDVLNALKQEMSGSYEDVESGVKEAFRDSVALAAVNYGSWETMEKILNANSGALGVKLDKYNDLKAAQKTTVNKAIFKSKFETAEGFETFFDLKVSTAGKPASQDGGGGGGGGGSAVKPDKNDEDEITDTILSDKEIPKPEQSDNNQNIGATEVFADVQSSHWANAAIDYCRRKSIINGYDDGSFRPDGNITRAEFLTIVLKTFGIDTSDKVCEFNDVAEDSWYYGTVAAATELGISTGYDDGSFRPDLYITREDMCVFITRALKASDCELKKTTSVKYDDSDDVASYATDSIKTLSEAGIVNGVGDNMFAPKSFVNRAMAAKISYELELNL